MSIAIWYQKKKKKHIRVPSSNCAIAIKTAISTIAFVAARGDVVENVWLLGSGLVEERIKEAEGGRASVEECVVQERNETSKRGRRSRRAVDLFGLAWAAIALAHGDEVVVTVERNIRISSVV